MAIALIAGPGTAGGAGGGVVGSWRVYSSRLDYDQGGSSTSQPLSSRVLKIKSGHRWEFGSSSGRWSTGSITAADWRRWNVEPYGPKSKIVLKGWNRTGGSGPIEASTRVDFIWVVYHVKPPTVSASGTIHTKFGRVRL